METAAPGAHSHPVRLASTESCKVAWAMGYALLSGHERGAMEVMVRAGAIGFELCVVEIK